MKIKFIALLRISITGLLIFLSVKLISHILGSTPLYHNSLNNWLSAVTPTESKWVRCYRALDDGWSAASFHQNCDNKGPTITLVKVQEFVFGGFLDQVWGGKAEYMNIRFINR